MSERGREKKGGLSHFQSRINEIRLLVGDKMKFSFHPSASALETLQCTIVAQVSGVQLELAELGNSRFIYLFKF